MFFSTLMSSVICVHILGLVSMYAALAHYILVEMYIPTCEIYISIIILWVSGLNVN